MSHLGSPVKAYDFLLKFLLVGDSDVGKGEILASLQDGATESPYGYHMGKLPPREASPLLPFSQHPVQERPGALQAPRVQTHGEAATVQEARATSLCYFPLLGK